MTDDDPLRFDVAVPPAGYAWWYLDAVSDDGRHALTIIAFVGSVFSPYYAHARHRASRRGGCADADDHCALNVALYGPGARWSMTERRRDAVRREASRFAIGPSVAEHTADGLQIAIDEIAVPIPRRIHGTVDVRTGCRPEHRVALDAAGRHTWRVIAPCARVDVRLESPDLAWTGEAYVDTNRGETSLEDDFATWDWSRAHLADGRAAVVYDVTRRAGGTFAIAQCFDAHGRFESFDAPPRAALPRTRWGLAPATRCAAGATPRVLSSFEDGPFYARALVETSLLGEPARGIHEHLSLDRFRHRAVRALLPFRMPRR